MIFKMYECDFGVKVNGVTYDFEHVESVTIEDPTTTKLVRGANSSNLTGLVYQEGIKDPKMVTVVLIGLSAELHTLLKGVYEDKSRCDVFIVNRLDGSAKIGKNAVLTQTPQQLTIDENPDSMNVSLAFATYDLSEDHKS